MNINSMFTLNNGVKIPIFGLGTYQCRPGIETRNAIFYALEIGYRLIDTAAAYGNEEDIGQAIRDSDVSREEVFITTKVWNSDQGFDHTLYAFEDSLMRLRMDYVDLYLIHWPVPNLRKDTWKALERIYREGRSRSIGVSNYTIRHLEEMKNYSDTIPSVNQVEFSPYLYQRELLDYCRSKGIVFEAYSPLTRGKKFTDPRLIAISKKYSKTPAQILIRWALQMDTVVIPKSARKERIKENSEVFDFEISGKDMTTLNNLNENFRPGWNPSDIP